MLYEVITRVIFVQNDAKRSDSIIRVPINPTEVFDEISFDPRLEAFERHEREAVVQSLGYAGKISDTGLYQRTILQVGLIGEDAKRGEEPAEA